MSLTWRPLTAADAPAWATLVAAGVEADGGELYSAEDLAEELDDSRSIAAFDDRELVAVGSLMAPVRRADGDIRAEFDGVVHPKRRGQGIGSELLDRVEKLVAEWVAEVFPGAEVWPSTPVASESARELLAGRGYEPIRWFHTLDIVPSPAFRNPRVQRHRPELDEAVRQAHLAAFAGHWGFAPPSPQRWDTWYTGARPFRPQFSSVAATIDGRVDAYVLAYQYTDDEVYLGQIGVRPEVRGRGLARNLILATLAEVAQSGIEKVALNVDSENADGAGRLYESVGFRRRSITAIYQKMSDA